MPPAQSSAQTPAPASEDQSGLGSNRTLIITLSTVLSVVGVLLVVGAMLLCCRYKRRRLPFFNRGISPIDDDEIETWKVNKPAEKEAAVAAAAGVYRQDRYTTSGRRSHAKQPSSGSTIKSPPSVIVYQRQSEELASPRSFTAAPTTRTSRYGARVSLDKDLPGTPAQARAPNARAGLTDETVPGDPSFLPSPRRQTSRLSKPPPARGASSHHHRTRSSRSSATSLRSFMYAGSEMELQMPTSPRVSNDAYRGGGHHSQLQHHHSSSSGSGQQHSRVYSSSSVPPRLSFSDDTALIGGLSPRPLFRDDIGRAIG